MPDITKDENLEDILDDATMKYGKIQDEINQLPVKRSFLDIPPPGVPDLAAQKVKRQFDALYEQQQKVKKDASQKSQELSKSKSPEEIKAIENRVEEWDKSDIYDHYKHLKSLEPVATSAIKANEQLREHEKNPTKSWKNFLDQDLNYTEQSKKETKPEKNTSDKKMSMADRFSMDLNYHGLSRSDIGDDKYQQAKSYADSRDEITSRSEPGGNAESKEVDRDKGE